MPGKFAEQIYSSASYSYSDSGRKRNGMGLRRDGGALKRSILVINVKAPRYFQAYRSLSDL